MRKIIFSMMAICLSMTFVPGELKASPDSLRTGIVLPAAEAQLLLNRLEEIKSMDHSAMSKSEKKALRKEVRSIDKQLRGVNGGIYISVGTLIVILILLILFA